MTNAPRRLVAYVRVSTVKQVDNTSLLGQRERIAQYCAGKGHEIVEVYSDDGESGSSMNRSQFDLACKHVFEGGADGIVVYSLDRFARNATRGWQLVADLDEAGKDLVVVNRDLDTTGPTGKLIRNILLAVAEYELSLIQERFANGRQAKKNQGGYYSGQPRFGWRSVGGRVEPVASEQWTIRVMERLRGLGLTSYKTAQYLNRRIHRHATKNGGAWTHRSVERILDQANNAGNGYKTDLQAPVCGEESQKNCGPRKTA